jgi:hypothetical protein
MMSAEFPDEAEAEEADEARGGAEEMSTEDCGSVAAPPLLEVLTSMFPGVEPDVVAAVLESHYNQVWHERHAWQLAQPSHASQTNSLPLLSAQVSKGALTLRPLVRAQLTPGRSDRELVEH